ncbi:lipopolysaccharide transport periplasmic protein LptA [Massilia sp. Leaf139]|uniref:lipopolysaccharide transport periplasmic protein LptA n=1 Tax=Massilia sp. Leaf139 TaxID=1736272 RepID=UPI0006F8A1EE|nr:lipopolysaccharide transport periplasmic protein LptA [Massilia sp. Leaf139]KQQ86610.1 ABC transporter substrate-binding protein [Massilia sp. Leaf139]
MKKLFAAAFVSLLSLSLSTAQAERADSLKQAVVSFDSLDVDEVTQTRIVTGNVVLTRGTLTLKSDRALIKETPEGYMSVTLTSAPGRVATFRQKRDGGPDLWMEGQAERIEYDERVEVVKLFSKAVVKELENGRLTNELDGAYISYDSRREVATVRNDASGESKVGGGRGTLIIAPRRTTAAPAAAAPSAPSAAPAAAPAAAGKK